MVLFNIVRPVYYVYILGNVPRTALYVGVTNDLSQRLEQHGQGLHPGFTAQHGACHLLYFERHHYIKNAIKRESN